MVAIRIFHLSYRMLNEASHGSKFGIPRVHNRRIHIIIVECILVPVDLSEYQQVSKQSFVFAGRIECHKKSLRIITMRLFAKVAAGHTIVMT